MQNHNQLKPWSSNWVNIIRWLLRWLLRWNKPSEIHGRHIWNTNTRWILIIQLNNAFSVVSMLRMNTKSPWKIWNFIVRYLSASFWATHSQIPNFDLMLVNWQPFLEASARETFLINSGYDLTEGPLDVWGHQSTPLLSRDSDKFCQNLHIELWYWRQDKEHKNLPDCITFLN